MSDSLTSPKHEVFRHFLLVLGVITLLYSPIILYLGYFNTVFSKISVGADILMVFADAFIVIGVILIALSFKKRECIRKTSSVVMFTLGILFAPVSLGFYFKGFPISIVVFAFTLVFLSILSGILLHFKRRAGWLSAMFLCILVITASVADIFSNLSKNLFSMYAKDVLQVTLTFLAFAFIKSSYAEYFY